MLVIATTLLAGMTGRVLSVIADGSPDVAGVAREELAYLRTSLDHGGGQRMQKLFPEGYFFTNVLYGLALTDLAAAGHGDRRAEGAEATRVLGRLASPAGTAVFDRELSPSYGVFYTGWSLLLRAQTAALVEPAGRAGDELSAVADRLAGAVKMALDTGGSPFLLSYPGRSWPVDTVVAMAALRRADQVTGADHRGLVDRWLRRAEAFADPATGLLPHEADPVTGRGLGGARGSSQSIIQRFWPVLDPAGAPASYQRFRSTFLTRRFGVVGVREYPRGVAGGGDVDSGPLVAGLSASATAVTIAAARAHGDQAVAVSLTHEADVFGLPFRWFGSRRYLGGCLPVADAFLVWARTTPLPMAGSNFAAAPMVWWPAVLLGLPWLGLAAAWTLTVRRRLLSSPDRGLRCPVPPGQGPY
ncbi:hypothetical protein [Frankia sp. AgKG'84/4]|uniref:hypothetical protein n=1 Tax=Frankia sp. AgKG'84/4 TaxID=573490 RepID=UPI00202A6546|nr:hypothetical protein [Frankia sp. AgKG'84/4]MCL9793196.1 hypothetical protein [Frankia sp. AgKG'84/4]